MPQSNRLNDIPRNILRGIVPTATLWDGTIGYAYLDDGGVFTDDTTDANSAAANDVPLMPAVPVLNDAFYFGEGFSTSDTFDSLKFNIGTAGVGGTIAWEYYTIGAVWASLTVTDATNGFTTAGAALYVTWTIPADMNHVAVNGQDRYWVRARVLTAFAPIPLATQIWLGKYPTNLVNIVDGNMSTVSGTGTVVLSVANLFGVLTFDLGAIRNIIVVGRFGLWSSASSIFVTVESSDDNITFRGTTAASAGGYPFLVTVTSSTERIAETLVNYANGRYIRLRFTGGAAATENARIYSVLAYELGL